MSGPGAAHRPLPPLSFRVMAPITCVTAGSASVKTVDRMSIAIASEQLVCVCVCVCVCGILVSVAEGERKLETQGERGRLAEVRKMWVMLAPSVTRLVDNSEVCFCYQPVRTARALTSWCGKGRHRLFPGYSAYKVSRDDSRGRVVRC